MTMMDGWKTPKEVRKEGNQEVSQQPPSSTRSDDPHANVHNPSRHHQHAQEIRREKHDGGDQHEPEPTQPFQPPVLLLLGLGPPGRLDAVHPATTTTTTTTTSGPSMALALTRTLMPVPAVVDILFFFRVVLAPIIVVVVIVVVVGRFSLVGLSRVVETLGEASPSTRVAVAAEIEATTTGEAAGTREATAAAKRPSCLAAHHLEEDIRVHTHATHAAAAKHVGGVSQVDAAVVALALPACGVSICSEICNILFGVTY